MLVVRVVQMLLTWIIVVFVFMGMRVSVGVTVYKIAMSMLVRMGVFVLVLFGHCRLL